MIIRKNYYSYLYILCFTALVGCDNDDDTPMEEEEEVVESLFLVGLGVTDAAFNTTNFVLGAEDVMTGALSLEGEGTLQDGYRDYAYTGDGDTFYSIGGLGVVDVNKITANEDNTLNIESGLTFPFQLDGFRDVDGSGTTMVGVSLPQQASTSEDITFYTVDVASNSITNQNTIPVRDVYDETRDWIFTTGMQVVGNKLYHTFYPIDAATFTTANTDKQYVAIYDYPAFTLVQVITDERFGPAGAFNTRSGIFATEGGDIYTVSNSNFGYTQATKEAGILKLNTAGDGFDTAYTFNTETATNGGKIIHAIYIGGSKLFAAISTKELDAPDGTNGFGNVYTDSNLHLAIVDLENQTITKVTGAPEYTGNGGRSFAAYQDGDDVYSYITDAAGVNNIYRIDLTKDTATKGAQVDATFVGGITKLK